MEALWSQGELSIREIQETFAAKRRPAYNDDPDDRLPS